MAESTRMTAGEVVDKLMDEEHRDVVRESVAWMVAELIEAEVSAQIGAAHGEVAPERVTQRNGYRPRGWDTRAGEIELAIPKLRTGSYFPSFLEPRKRSEQALVAVVQEAYVKRNRSGGPRPISKDSSGLQGILRSCGATRSIWSMRAGATRSLR